MSWEETTVVRYLLNFSFFDPMETSDIVTDGNCEL